MCDLITLMGAYGLVEINQYLSDHRTVVGILILLDL